MRSFLRQFCKAFLERHKIKSRATADDGQLVIGPTGFNFAMGVSQPRGCRVVIRATYMAEKAVGNQQLIFRARSCRDESQFFVHLHRIRIDNYPAKRLCLGYGQSRLAAGRWPCNK